MIISYHLEFLRLSPQHHLKHMFSFGKPMVWEFGGPQFSVTPTWSIGLPLNLWEQWPSCLDLLKLSLSLSLLIKFDNGKSVISVGRSFASEQFLLRKLDYQMLIYRYLQYINLPIIWGRCLTMLHFWEFRSSSTNRWITNEKKQLGDLRSPGRI